MQAFTQDELLEIIKASMDEFWWGQIVENGPAGGLDILNALCELFQHLSSSVSELSREVLPCYANGPGRAKVPVTFARTVTTATLNIPAGEIVFTPFGLMFTLDEPVSFAISDDGPYTVSCTAINDGSDYNVTKNCITGIRKSSTFNPTAHGLTVTNQGEASGGMDMSLDMHAANKGIVRDDNETDKALFQRMNADDDRNTVASIKRVLAKFSSLGLLDGVIEYRPGYDSGLFLDDESYLDAGADSSDPYYRKFEQMLLSRNDSRRSFFAVIPAIKITEEYPGIILDEGLADYQSAIDLTGESVGFLDARDTRAEGFLASMHAELEDKKPAGIRHALIAQWSM